MPDMNDDQLSEVYSFAVQLGKDAGDMLMKAARRRFDNQSGPSTSVAYVEKDNAVDIVTSTDNGKLGVGLDRAAHNILTLVIAEVEAFIHKAIQDKFPSHKCVILGSSW